MMNLLSTIRQAIHELIHGRNLPDQQKIQLPPKIITVNIQTEKIVKNRSVPVKVSSPPTDTLEVTRQAVLSQTGDTAVVLPYEDPQILNQLTKTNRGLVFKYIIKRLSKAIRLNWPKVIVFQFGKSSKVAQIDASVYETQLDGMMKWFVETEDYESAGTCRDLIRQLKPNGVTDSTT